MKKTLADAIKGMQAFEGITGSYTDPREQFRTGESASWSNGEVHRSRRQMKDSIHKQKKQKPPAKPIMLTRKALALLIVGCLCLSCLFGLGGAHWGGYLRFSSNFRPAEPFTYDCKSDGSTEYGVFWSSGARAVSRLTLTGGGWIPCTDWLRIYAGGGFGRRTVCWQDSRGGWARVTDYSAAGLTLEAGIVLNLGHFALSLGGETISFRSCGLTVGAGFSF